MGSGGAAVLDLRTSSSSTDRAKVVSETVKMKRKIFPKHESLSTSFDEELKKKNSRLLYVHVNDEFAGYVMYSRPSSLSASITKLADLFPCPSNVEEKFRRRGLGEALLKAAIQKCRTWKVQRVSLHVDPLRAPAVSLHKKLGFEVDTLIEGYYSSDRNAYRMYLDFDSSWWYGSRFEHLLCRFYPCPISEHVGDAFR